jgi:hypothetical protein
MNTAKKSKYKTYGSIYQNQCVNCLKEGTYKCALEIENEECKNYSSVKKGDVVFGGY